MIIHFAIGANMEEIKNACSSCPRRCGIDRKTKKGFCGASGLPRVAKAFLHMWEEPCISGTKGSGTIFFSGCNLKCAFCQNYPISQENYGKEITIERLAEICLELQEKGAHNINLVNPTHYTEAIIQSIKIAKLDIPVIYNSNGYESLEQLKAIEGLVDVYLPDIKYHGRESALKYSGCPDYFVHASSAVMEMYRQVGETVFDEDGIIKKGMIIRHLILPCHTNESIKILDWIRAKLPQDVYVSLMSQYIPFYKAELYPEINRRLIRREYDKVLKHFCKLGFENGYVQERNSAEEDYIPAFDLEGV